MIDLGDYKNKVVCFESEAALNQHILILGKSGCGKSVQMQRIISDLSQQGKTLVIFDMHSVASKEQIFPLHRDIFEQNSCEIDVYHDGISCDLFLPLTFPDGEKEKKIDTVGAIVDILARATKLGSGQRAILRKAISHVANTGEYNRLGLWAIDCALAKEGTVAAEAVREKLYQLTAHNIFRPGKLFLERGKINIIRLSRFDLETQRMVAELLLSYFWRVSVTSEFSKDGIYLCLDELQNLSYGKDSALSQMLTEGRKFNVNLILATQQFDPRSTSSVQQKLMQCGLILLFQPNTAQAGILAKLVDSNDAKNWTRVLQTLDKGEFVTLGPVTVNGVSVSKPLKVSAKIELEGITNEIKNVK